MTNNQQAAREWLPIESAPKDERWILLYHDGAGEYLIAQWFHGAWWGQRTQSGRAITWRSATHWQPLPAPPGLAKECAHQWRVDPDLGEGSGYLYCPRCDCTRRSPTPQESEP